MKRFTIIAALIVLCVATSNAQDKHTLKSKRVDTLTKMNKKIPVVHDKMPVQLGISRDKMPIIKPDTTKVIPK